MFQVRIHGRGGQGVVTSSELLSIAAFLDGYWAQAFPNFGSERMGAPVTAYCRIDSHEIRTHEPISAPDALIVQDATLVHQVDILSGVNQDALILINTPHSLDDPSIANYIHGLTKVFNVPASETARRHLGKPIPNLVLLGGLAALTGIITLQSLHEAIVKRFAGDLGEKNYTAAKELFNYVQENFELPPMPSMPMRTEVAHV